MYVSLFLMFSQNFLDSSQLQSIVVVSEATRDNPKPETGRREQCLK